MCGQRELREARIRGLRIRTRQRPLVGTIDIPYLLGSVLDQMQIDAVLDEELEWKPDPNDRHLEKFRKVTRSRLPNERQVTEYRMGELLRRML